MDRISNSTDRSLSARLAATAFGLYIAVALPLVVFGLGRYFWFLGDDWDFLTERQAGSIHDLLRPHAEHLSALPILVTRMEWPLFGFHYWRYQFVVVVLHLTVAVLLRIILRRIGIGPWTASAAAAIFVLFSPGYENILWSFQLAWVMTLTFGLLQLIAADHPGRGIERRDWLGLAAGLGAVLSAGVAPIMIGVVGVATLLRRGWRAAAFHTVPLGSIFIVWFALTRGDQPKTSGHVTPSALIGWLHQGYSAIFVGLGAGRPLAVVFLAIIVVGVTVAWGPLVRNRQWDELRNTAAIPVAMAIGGLGFQLATANSRWAFGSIGARSARYVHVGALLMIPLLAVGADALARRWKAALPIVVVLLLAPIPGHIRGFDATGDVFSKQYFDRQRQFVEAIAWSPLAEEVPRSSRPIRDWLGGEGPPVGWLLDARRADKIPRPANVPPGVLDEVKIRLGLKQSFASGAGAEPGLVCRTYSERIELRPDRGDAFILKTPMGVRLLDPRAPMFLASAFTPLEGTKLQVALDDLELAFTPLAPAKSFRLCS